MDQDHHEQADLDLQHEETGQDPEHALSVPRDCGEELPLPVWGEGGGKIIAWTRVHRDDWRGLKRWRWWLADGYALRSVTLEGRKTTISMHRQLMGLGPDDPREVDHGDRDRLHNCRCNLTVVTRWENETNKPRSELASSQYVGVTLDVRTGRWKAQASHEGRYIYLGMHESEIAAAAARRRFDDVHREKINRENP